MNDDELMILMKKVDPESVRIPPGVRGIVDAVILAERKDMPNLEAVIIWLENGCDPKEAVKELRIYQKRMHPNGVFSGTPSGVSAGKQG